LHDFFAEQLGVHAIVMRYFSSESSYILK